MRVPQASRDHGVDAIVFDPAPAFAAACRDCAAAISAVVGGERRDAGDRTASKSRPLRFAYAPGRPSAADRSLNRLTCSMAPRT